MVPHPPTPQMARTLSIYSSHSLQRSHLCCANWQKKGTLSLATDGASPWQLATNVTMALCIQERAVVMAVYGHVTCTLKLPTEHSRIFIKNSTLKLNHLACRSHKAFLKAAMLNRHGDQPEPTVSLPKLSCPFKLPGLSEDFLRVSGCFTSLRWSSFKKTTD